jgi:lipid II:glycine glycyltransferase (peptidoglycan interpeptide bridge formation enzyme)
VIDLSPGFDMLRQGFSRGQKSNLRQAQKKGLAIRRAETAQDISAYYDIYGETLKRWGEKTAAVYPRTLFFNLFEQKDSHIQFYLAEKQGQVIAGIILLAWQKKLLYWHGCSREEFFRDYPNNLLHAEAIKWACENSFSHYDMGASMDLEGVVSFKKSFGAEERAFASYRWK